MCLPACEGNSRVYAHDLPINEKARNLLIMSNLRKTTAKNITRKGARGTGMRHIVRPGLNECLVLGRADSPGKKFR
jgi:hypothetical protein